MRLSWIGWASCAAVLGACASDPMHGPPLGEVVDPSAEFSHVRYDDTGLESVNDRCPVTGTPLNTSIEPIYANGRPIGFC